MSFVRQPHLPSRPIRGAIVSTALSLPIRTVLHKRGIVLYDAPVHPNLPNSISHHPDLVAFHLGGNRLLVADEIAHKWSIPDVEIYSGKSLSPNYPNDIAFDACLLGDALFCLAKATDPQILQIANHIYDCKQGYAKCSIVVVQEDAAITEDVGLARTLKQAEKDVLLISPGGVSLPDYDRGFIGGACGKLAPDILAFFGRIENHPDYDAISKFCQKHGVQAISLSNDNLVDFGSLLPILE